MRKMVTEEAELYLQIRIITLITITSIDYFHVTSTFLRLYMF